MIGIGVGRNTHTLVQFEGATPVTQFIPNSAAGIEQALAALNGSKSIVFMGNRRWATPFAYALRAHEVKCLYFPMQAERGKRGKAGDVGQMLQKAFAANIKPRPFFPPDPSPIKTAELPNSYRLALEYIDASNEVRRAKHNILDCLLILFPEAVKAVKIKKWSKTTGEISLPVPQPQPPDIFGRRMRAVLENPNPRDWEGEFDDIGVLAQNSLGKYIPKEVRAKTLAELKNHLAGFDRLVALKQEQMAQIKEATAEHPLVKHFGGGELISVLVALLGWRVWPSWKAGNRELRRFAGLDVARIDSKGKARISRVRTEIRQYLYLLGRMTNKGKEIFAEVPKGRYARVKRLEHLLKYLLHNGLNQSQSAVETSAPSS